MSLNEYLPRSSVFVVSLMARRRGESGSPINSTRAPLIPCVSDSSKTMPFIQLRPDCAAAIVINSGSAMVSQAIGLIRFLIRIIVFLAFIAVFDYVDPRRLEAVFDRAVPAVGD